MKIKNTIIILSIFAVIVSISGCITKPEPTEDILLDEEGTIPQDLCLERNLADKVIILESKYCGACKIAVPQIKEIESELNANFIYFDLSEKEDSEKLEEFKIIPKYTPTVLIGCDIYIGAKSKETYKQLIQEFLET